jgi:uncharacterized protein (DUF3084 family)
MSQQSTSNNIQAEIKQIDDQIKELILKKQLLLQREQQLDPTQYHISLLETHLAQQKQTLVKHDSEITLHTIAISSLKNTLDVLLLQVNKLSEQMNGMI